MKLHKAMLTESVVLRVVLYTAVSDDTDSAYKESHLRHHQHRMILAGDPSTLKLAVVDDPISNFLLGSLVKIGIRLSRISKL